MTLIGRIVPVEADELPAIRTAYSIVHSYSERLVESPKFQFCKVRFYSTAQQSRGGRQARLDSIHAAVPCWARLLHDSPYSY